MHGATSSESIFWAQLDRSADSAAVRSAMSEMEGSRGQRVLDAPSQGGCAQDGLETASLEDEAKVNTALNP
ncbi:hypothetical protein XI06_37935 [Bradyrhizobium sp. CCBAU 11434]|nr:hypothetical protein [Bradyrhizobium sp. CCBAU 11434]